MSQIKFNEEENKLAVYRMRIGLFVKAGNSRIGGGVTFERQLITDLLREADGSDHQFLLFSPDRDLTFESSELSTSIIQVKWSLLRRAVGGISNVVNLLFARVLSLPYPLPYEGWLDRILLKHRVEFFVNLTPSTMTMEIPYLTCVWDLQHRLQPFFPEVNGRGRWERSDHIFRTLLRRAAYVVVLGPQGKRELEQFYSVSDDRIKTLSLPTPEFALAAGKSPKRVLPPQYGLEPGYLFYPAQFWPHKNHVSIVFALKALAEKYAYYPTAVFVGADEGNLAHVKELAGTLGVQSQIRYLGFVPRDDLVALYQNALSLVFPSMFGPENFPPLEAFALGCPVIASAVPGAEAQLGNAALLVDPSDHLALAETIQRLYASAELRTELVALGRARALTYTGKDFARDVFSLLDEFAMRRRCWSGDHRYSPTFSWQKLLKG